MQLRRLDLACDVFDNDVEVIMSARPGRAGFSLIEVMLAGVLLGLAVLVLAKMLGASSQGLSVGKGRTVAQQLALQRLESLASLGPDRVPACPPSPGCRADFTSLTGPLGTAGGFACTQTVLETGFARQQPEAPQGAFRVDVATDLPADPNQMAGARLLQVSVCWSREGRVEQVQVSRLLVPEV
jgi:hypothetical protein